ncbi:MAG TPA: hypothetical protein PK867_12565 [Pirellulales bacterium]|nr:hypothetical protein [Pirellulales bacterium]
MINTSFDESTMTESEFLDAQAADAQAALHETWNDIKGTLRETASLEVWAQRHPWLVAGAAVAGGFVLAAVLFSPAEEAEPAVSEAEEPPANRAGPGHRRFSRLWAPVFSLVRPILGQLVTSLVGALLAGVGAAKAHQAAEADGMPAADDGGPEPVM